MAQDDTTRVGFFDPTPSFYSVLAHSPQIRRKTPAPYTCVSKKFGQVAMLRSAKAVADYLRGTSGAVSLEFAIWVPLVFGIFLTVMDLTHALTVNSTMWHQARVAARGLSMHEISTQEARSLINGGLTWTRSDYVVEIVEDRATVWVSIRTPMKTSGIIDFATARLQGDWVARVEMLREPV